MHMTKKDEEKSSKGWKDIDILGSTLNRITKYKVQEKA